MRSILLILLGLSVTSELAAQTVSDIKITGLKRTDPAVVENELPFTKGDTFRQADLDEGVLRLKNTGLFSKVEATTSKDAEGNIIVNLTTQDRWTTIPIAKFASGGGVNQVIVGVFDPNVLGQFFELGAQYERLGETNSGVAWFKDPRLFDQRMGLFIQAWQVNRIRRKYFQDQIEPTLKTGFLHTRKKYSIELSKEFAWWLEGAVTVEHHDDSFSDQYLDEEVLAVLNKTGLPPDTKVNLYGARFKFGRLAYDSYLVDGIESKVSYLHGMHSEDGFVDFDQVDIEATAATTIFSHTTLAQRVMLGATNTETLQYWYYLGGLDRVRGFSDNRFAGRYYWLSNSEVRQPIYRGDNLVVQANAFHDVTSVGEGFEELNKASGASVGGGLRFIAPKIYRLVARLDFAYPIVKRDEIPISFGVQQFF